MSQLAIRNRNARGISNTSSGDIPSQADLADAGASGTSSGKPRSGESSQSAQVPIDSDSD